LKKAFSDPVGEPVVFSQAEPSLDLIADDRSMPWQSEKDPLSSG
jgi:hypothetical protein